TFARRQSRRGRGSAVTGTASREERYSRPLSHVGAVWRQSRRRAGGEPGLFRQGAAASVARRGGIVGRTAARAGTAAPGPASRGGAAGALRGPRPHARGGRHLRA